MTKNEHTILIIGLFLWMICSDYFLIDLKNNMPVWPVFLLTAVMAGLAYLNIRHQVPLDDIDSDNSNSD